MPSRSPSSEKDLFSKVPEGHHPRGTTLREALRGNSGFSQGFTREIRDFFEISEMIFRESSFLVSSNVVSEGTVKVGLGMGPEYIISPLVCSEKSGTKDSILERDAQSE